MRKARIKPDYMDTWHHCYNRAVGTAMDRPFGDVEKEQFVRILKRVSKLYTIRIASYQVMSNHFHLLVHAPCRIPSEEETCRRYKAFHRGKRTLTPGTPLCKAWQARLRDVSWFMRHLQQLFASWFNRTRPIRRRGSLWAARFENVILEKGIAVWRCWNYVEHNPVRAKMVLNAADYRFCSYGVWSQRGRHPFEEHLNEIPLSMLVGRPGVNSLDEAYILLNMSMNSRAKWDDQRNTGFLLTAQRRVRYWVNGCVIGSELFIKQIMNRRYNGDEIARHRLVRSADTDRGEALYAWRRLRNLPN